MNSLLEQIKKVIERFQVRMCFLIVDKQQKTRYGYLQDSELDEYAQQVDIAIFTFEWVCNDLREKAVEALMLEAFFSTE